MLERRTGPIDHGLVDGDALVLAPHPDDETIACGGLIAAKRSAGHRVDVVVATDGATSHTSTVLTPDELVEVRRAEVREATSRLGLANDQLHLLELPDGRLGQYAASATRALESLLSTHEYDQVFLPSRRDWNADHRALAAIGATVAGPHPSSARLYSYPVWFFEPWAWYDPGASRPAKAWQSLIRPIVGLGRARVLGLDVDGVLAIKVHALEAYQSQLINLTGEADWAVLPRSLIDRACATVELYFEGVGP
jgi:LmbE family N-acetylglucosaminyl deacetylase